MSRPRKWRIVCDIPSINCFGPHHNDPSIPPLSMSIEEYECIRLIDLEKLTQEEVSQRMQVARTTVQRIYELARWKLAKSLVEGCMLNIEGGDYELCDGQQLLKHCGFCHRKGLGHSSR
jgi:uncharacterized protein